MNVFKTFSKPGESPEKPDGGRRSFLWRSGAAVSAVLASAVAGVSKSSPDQDAGLNGDVEKLSNKIGRLEDADVVRHLHQTYESYLDKGMYEEAAGMFTDAGEAVYNGGLFAGKAGIRRLYCDHFAPRQAGKRIEPAPGFKPDPAQPEIVDVAADRKTATCQFPYSMQVGELMTGNSSFVEMARLQGGGIVKWWEGGICESSYVKVGESWKIRRLEYKTVSKADYRPGQTYAKPIDVPAFSKTYPKNPAGPDKLILPQKA
jgi:hypothetical protein